MLLSESRPNIFNSFKADSPDDEFGKQKQNVISRLSLQKPPSRIIMLEDENDDDDERLARRRSRLLEPHPASFSSPGASSTAARRRADAAAPRGIPQAQIGEHYGNCIRLAAENKITAKNAFNLHLIDYMSEMIKKEDFASFQIASSSLDAGAKIYAGRVDAVHQETYQVLTGLGHSGNPQNEENEGNADNVDDDGDNNNKIPTHSKPEQKKKTAAHRDIIHKQLNKIRTKTLADKIDLDPLFQHQTAAYDEGGTAELRLNQLSTANASCELILDSSTPVMLRSLTTIQPTTLINITNINEFLSLILARSLNQLSICSTLQNFRFTDWDVNMNNCDLSNQMNWDTNSQSVNLLSQDNANDDDDEDNGINRFPVQDDSFCNNSIHEDINVAPVFETGKQIEVNGSSAEAAINDIGSHGLLPNIAVTENTTTATTTTADGEVFVSCLKSMLDKQYEHFGKLNDHLLGMWAGPEHWHKKAKRPKLDGAVKLNEVPDNPEGKLEHRQDENDMENVVKGKSNRNATKSKKDKVQRISYAEATKPSENRTRSGSLNRRDWPKDVLSSGVENSATSNPTVFKESYKQKANSQMNVLPSQWSRQTLYQLVNRDVTVRPNILSGRRNLTSRNNITGENTDMIGINELCAVLTDDINERPLTVNNEYEDIDGGMDQLGNHQDDDDDDDVIIPFECAFTQNAGYSDGEFGDIELISQPNKVARIEIGYARTAKMINVQRLKCAMWGFLEHTVPHVSVNIPSESPLSVASTTSAPDANILTDDPTSVNLNKNQQHQMNENIIRMDSEKMVDLPKVPGARSFSELIDSLSGRISWQMAKELSISIALNCLLHLSNEKQLYLENVNSFSDIFISQGLPSFELKLLETYTNTCDSDDRQLHWDITSGGNIPKPSNNQKRNKVHRMRPSTLDSWIIEND
ncbi:Condensin complex subunit 2 [Schistosoma japonicum]|uniref:Condensin complex subunit 2 n=1 Tax=Schistosoma japonicum TaxID=6182 RepID=A0A4Z2DSL9_SCHJA|nr:Condensin complex subunit 2 [Schistosoma japonicum]TNN19534.1 Condensin complex subunit 2 [Schistosoma japonicum]TNN19535.1 Condensin complex subunit 2 [Schistosoma japonicum]